jgi:methylenetetrahydrofolate dehydrogenase (NADP+) / methenyltetrahydrofolate cyclohydrolase
MQLLYGDIVANKILDDLAEKTKLLPTPPTLAVIIVGDDYASQRYVTKKHAACQRVGITSLNYELSESTEETQLIELINELNQREDVDGILLQLPLPKHLDTTKIINQISPKKDVDGLHPYNLGQLMINEPGLRSCTPKGVITLLNYYGIELSGKNVVVVGRSRLVGKPLAGLLINENATVTIAHSKTKNLRQLTNQADLVISAIGSPKFFDSSYFGQHTIVIDVGINMYNNSLCGDVDIDSVRDKVSALTPVPRGIGPLTIACLLQNTLEAYLEARKLWTTN